MLYLYQISIVYIQRIHGESTKNKVCTLFLEMLFPDSFKSFLSVYKNEKGHLKWKDEMALFCRVLFCKTYRTGFADYRNLDLTRISHFILNLLGYFC